MQTSIFKWSLLNKRNNKKKNSLILDLEETVFNQYTILFFAQYVKS